MKRQFIKKLATVTVSAAMLAALFSGGINADIRTAQAQEAYDNAMKLIEAGKLLLSDGEKAIIDKAQQRLLCCFC